MQILRDILLQLIDILAESGPYILLGFLIAGVLHVFLPERLFSRLFGRTGIMPLLRAIGLGSIIPVCSCGVVPIGIGAWRGGAGTGTVLAFMTSAPTLSPASVLLSAKLLGLEITGWQVAFVVLGSLVQGLLGNRLFTSRLPIVATAPELVTLGSPLPVADCCRGSTPAPVVAPAVPACCASHPAPDTEHITGSPQRGKFHEMLHWIFVEFGPAVSLDMLVGLIFAASVLTLVPSDWIVLLTGSKTIWSLLLVILVALPVYTCSMAAIPVVFTFLLAGMSPGAAVAFIIAGPATNFGEMNALRGQIGWKVAAYYFVSLLVIAIAAGAIVDHIVMPAVPQLTGPAAHHHGHGTGKSLLQWTSLLILAAMMLTELFRRSRRLLPTGLTSAEECKSC